LLKIKVTNNQIEKNQKQHKELELQVTGIGYPFGGCIHSFRYRFRNAFRILAKKDGGEGESVKHSGFYSI